MKFEAKFGSKLLKTLTLIALAVPSAFAIDGDDSAPQQQAPQGSAASPTLDNLQARRRVRRHRRHHRHQRRRRVVNGKGVGTGRTGN
jgi:hypothetical protein